MWVDANVGLVMWREIIQLIIDIATDIRANRQRRKIERLEYELAEARELAEYRDYVRRENERRRMK